ncbi:NADH oxidase [Clostridium homopropionicum DSM 5847]|uniref:NADH oxidase n=1 Tax=Clostridium homopropionicum DSM 5847 TaxID=1121318 RepID=A0A0L6Z968_9CLOT|nr:NADH:flavin oxidoreductase [Clostridium homopropionicum]KOA19323.1 NADH oxidase [Clostridium homopropionicum DSM 5847]SFG21124.1 2,4-dienoyl-CoA reductase [Clostridium homopropionicum]
MTAEFSNLEAPIKINGKTIKNRIVVPPMADFGLTNPDGLISERHLQHYQSFADGGAGLIIIEACATSKLKEPRNTIGIFDDNCLEGLTLLAQAVKKNHAVAVVQMMNTGLSAMKENSLKEISRAQFLVYRYDFVSAAVRCKTAGFDGVELHAAHGFYLNQVTECNNRIDEYADGTRLLAELIIAIKEACGSDFLVDVRFGHHNKKELIKIAKTAETAGADFLNVSFECYYFDGCPESFPYETTVFMASLVKEVSTIPVICVGGITSAKQAEDILEKGYADMVAVGRGHLCDPSWANKVLCGIEPIPCRNCRSCLWYIDGRKCPARKNGGIKHE